MAVDAIALRGFQDGCTAQHSSLHLGGQTRPEVQHQVGPQPLSAICHFIRFSVGHKKSDYGKQGRDPLQEEITKVSKWSDSAK